MIAAAMMVVGPVLAWIGVVKPLIGFVIFALGGLSALLLGITALVRMVRGRGMTRGGLVAVLAGIAFVALAARGAGSPRINDFTTDLDDPPVFRNATSMAANQGRDMAYPASFIAVQRTCCPDLHPARLRGSTDDAFQRALGTAQAMPSWTITTTDPAAGIIEATSTSRLFHFVDDIVIRVRTDGGGQSRVDMRSKSRDGKGDMGANAARIRQYIERVEASAGARS